MSKKYNTKLTKRKNKWNTSGNSNSLKGTLWSKTASEDGRSTKKEKRALNH